MVTFHIITFSIMVTIHVIFFKIHIIFQKNPLTCSIKITNSVVENDLRTENLHQIWPLTWSVSILRAAEENSWLTLTTIPTHPMPNLNYWICSESKCSAPIRTRVSSSNLVGDLPPIHQHEYKLLKWAITEQETVVIRKMARIADTSNSRVLSEITPNLICGRRIKNVIE